MPVAIRYLGNRWVFQSLSRYCQSFSRTIPTMLFLYYAMFITDIQKQEKKEYNDGLSLAKNKKEQSSKHLSLGLFQKYAESR